MLGDCQADCTASNVNCLGEFLSVFLFGLKRCLQRQRFWSWLLWLGLTIMLATAHLLRFLMIHLVQFQIVLAECFIPKLNLKLISWLSFHYLRIGFPDDHYLLLDSP